MQKTALVTGANRGIGLEVARQLQDGGFEVLATARNWEASVKDVGSERLGLDVTSDASVRALRERLAGRSLDVLVNNAGVALDGFDEQVAARTIDTNVLGVVRVTEALLPLMRQHGRIVMVSSGAGELAGIGEPVQGELERLELGEEELMAMMRSFPEEVARGVHGKRGWPSSAYRVSKAGLNAYTRLLARRLQDDPRALLVNAVCPGWVRTDMGGKNATRSPEEGAKSVVWAALLGPDGPRGGFFRDGHAIDW
jgi:NAD(P)-dependent dehydrogenase (short-subunit alcohol dehydrogenase family)